MKSFKTLLLWILIYVIPFIIAFICGFFFGIFDVNEDFISVFVFGLLLFVQIWIYGKLAKKVKYRFRDTFLQFIPLYGIFWQFRICYRTVERLSNQITYY